jgi:hypothetical protein
MSTMAFIDETTRGPNEGNGPGYYQLTAALIDGPGVSALRAATVAVAPAGFHASELARRGDEAAVLAMLEHVAAAEECWNLVAMTYQYRTNGEQEMARQACLRLLLAEIDAQKIGHVVLDSREVLADRGGDLQRRNKIDLSTLADLRKSGAVDRHMTMSHVHDSQESLLWLPDAVGWAFRQQELRQDNTYFKVVAGVTTVHRIPPSTP